MLTGNVRKSLTNGNDLDMVIEKMRLKTDFTKWLAAEMGLIPNGSLFLDAKHCLDHSVTNYTLNRFTTPFYYRDETTT